MAKSKRTHYQACNICEAICGLEIQLEDEKIISIKGDKNDPFSQGHICPKAVALQDIYNDPDRLKQPVKKVNGQWKSISWNAAFDEVVTRLKSIQKQHGKDAVAVYQGNPTVHNLESMLYAPMFVRSLKTKNCYSATSVDQLPEQLVSLLMFGHSLMVPLPDLDRTDFLVIFGANPLVSNGSLMTAPGVKKRLTDIQKRGGKVVVFDPRKTETAKLSDQHFFVKPGTDALVLLSMLHVVFENKLQTLGKVERFTHDIDKVADLVKDYPPEKTASITGIDTSQLKQMVKNFCATPKATCYGRIGVSTHEFGALTQWLIVVFNIVTGKLDCAGGTMFSQPAFDILNRSGKKSNNKAKQTKQIQSRRKGFDDARSRVSGLPNFGGEFPVVALAEEIMTPGKGQIRALMTNSGNPVLSTPNQTQMDKALGELDFMFSIDFYINETTRHADIILPPVCALERPHYDVVFHALAVRNTTKFSSPLFKPGKNTQSDKNIFLELLWRMQSNSLFSRCVGWVKKEVFKWLGSEWIIDKQLKKGPYAQSHQLSLKKLKSNPHGLDLGELQPCLPERLFTADQMINLAPEACLQDIERLNNVLLENSDKANKTSKSDFLLIGRRDPRTNNSWLHNSYRMVKGKNRCTALMNIDDAQSLAINNGDMIQVESRVGQIEIEVSLTEEIMPGVISIPHGWGHNINGVKLDIATKHSGVNTNILTDEKFIDGLSGNAALNGVPISVKKTGSQF
ncbi:MAG: molybdopterin-dependent oxidoreductase [Gammaproteobacteria bacterium]|nr:molybdopterin-dependent oxidoreductase [Gammaproteobacteria bacterium]